MIILHWLKNFISPFSVVYTNVESLLTWDIVVREGVEFYCFFTSCRDWIMQMLAINSGKVVAGQKYNGASLFVIPPVSHLTREPRRIALQKV